MQLKLNTKKMKFEQALAVLSNDNSLTAKITFNIKPKVTLDQNEEITVKVKVPKKLKELFQEENKAIFEQLKINIFMEQFSVSTKNRNPSSNKKHINILNEKLGFAIRKGAIRIDEDNEVYFETKAGEKLKKDLNYKNLKKFLKVFAKNIEVLGEFQF